MRIGLLVMSVGSYGTKGFYNLQEIGLGKALCEEGHTVEIFKCVHKNGPDTTETIAPHLTLHSIGVTTVSNNAVFRCEEKLDDCIDVLVCFSDIQFWTTRVYRWAERRNILFIPYVGITHSTSPSPLKRETVNRLSGAVFKIYRKTGVFVKNSTVGRELREKGIRDVRVVPVGIDFDLMRKDYNVPRDALRKELGLHPELKYLLMVGRIESDRDPLDVVKVLEAAHEKDPGYRLIILGKGSLKDALFSQLAQKNLSDAVTYIPLVPNSDMWRYYRAADALVSFSRTEIFGMSILEAMYYELPVFVMHAPGPDDIITDGETGRLFDSLEDMSAAITGHIPDDIGQKAHRRIADHFSWSSMVGAITEKADSLRSSVNTNTVKGK